MAVRRVTRPPIETLFFFINHQFLIPTIVFVSFFIFTSYSWSSHLTPHLRPLIFAVSGNIVFLKIISKAGIVFFSLQHTLIRSNSQTFCNLTSLYRCKWLSRGFLILAPESWWPLSLHYVLPGRAWNRPVPNIINCKLKTEILKIIFPLGIFMILVMDFPLYKRFNCRIKSRDQLNMLNNPHSYMTKQELQVSS